MHSRNHSISQKPKEHGAYAILAVPIVTSFLIAGLSVVGICVALAAMCGFLANEPLLIVWGHRGGRAQRESQGLRARLVTLTALVVIAGAIALAVGDWAVRLSLLGCLLFATASFGVSIAGKHRTIVGQWLGVVVLSVPCVPILLGGGVPVDRAAWIWAAFLVGFSATTLAVRSVIAAQKRRPRVLHYSVLTALTLGVIAGWAVTPTPMIATLPMIAMSWYLMIRPPPARHLRRIGWALVAGTIASAGCMLAVTRWLYAA